MSLEIEDPQHPANQIEIETKAADLNEAIENYISDPTSDNLEEVRHYQGLEFERRENSRKVLNELKDYAKQVDNAYLKNKLNGIKL